MWCIGDKYEQSWRKVRFREEILLYRRVNLLTGMGDLRHNALFATTYFAGKTTQTLEPAADTTCSCTLLSKSRRMCKHRKAARTSKQN